MNLWRRKLRLAAVGAVAAIAMVAAGCSSSGGGSSSSSSSGGTPVSGGTATIALPAGVTYNYIFPFYPVTHASVYNLQFQYLLFRPLYIFGNNTGSSVSINYPLSTANPPIVQQRRQDRRGQHEGLEVVQRRDGQRQGPDLLPEHGRGGEVQLVRLLEGPAAGQPGLLQGHRARTR